MNDAASVHELVTRAGEEAFALLDLLPEGDLAEKLVSLALSGPPPAPAPFVERLARLARTLNGAATQDVRVVVFGGGTGLSNLIGGDSRSPGWAEEPFRGLKEIFPRTRAVVCVTDDGGSSGELLKDLPLIALGDLRHVLLSSVRREKLRTEYGLDRAGAARACAVLHRLFNHRFDGVPDSLDALLAAAGVDLLELPPVMGSSLGLLLEEIFSGDLLRPQLARPHCLGNLLLAAAICRQRDGQRPGNDAVLAGLAFLADCIGANHDGVLPCTTTPAQLKVLYANGVLVSGEQKSGQARRGCPVERVFVEFADAPEVPQAVLAAIFEADIILFAPGSLFTSIVPILQVPGIAGAIRNNRQALKVLVTNLWAQAGETDMAHANPGRRFHVSDLLAAYQRNIPGGVPGLFDRVLVLGLRDIPGSILQSYALENKVPIYLDRERVREMGFAALEARLSSQEDIDQRRVIQHDADSLAAAVRVLWAIRTFLAPQAAGILPVADCAMVPLLNPRRQALSARFAEIRDRLDSLAVDRQFLPALMEIFWNHGDIPAAHLDYIAGLALLEREERGPHREWDNILSFYDPADRLIKIRGDLTGQDPRFEAAVLMALGQSLLGDYAAEKISAPVVRQNEELGYEFRLILRPEAERHCFFSDGELARFLHLVRMRPFLAPIPVYTRLVNSNEGFTPPGLLFGLLYAWYLDNRFAWHVEYKMSITRMTRDILIPEQQKMASRRQALVDYFRTVVFRYDDARFSL